MSASTTPEQDALAELAKNLADPMWRLSSGALYKILIKGDNEDDDGLVIPFKPNRAQRRFISRLHHRNIILKARQLGFTTLIAIAWLDHALFNPNSRCGIIAQDRETAEAIFRDKVKFAYDNLPPALLAAMPLKNCTKSEMLFGHNNSSIRVATSVRGGTIQRLHVSEFGKICAKFPDKAAEVITGSIPAVPKSGILVIESTAEGRDGEFYAMTQRAMALQDSGKELTERDYRFHFFAWWQEPNYRMDPAGVIVTEKDDEYFAIVEAAMQTTLDAGQRAWYVATRDTDFSGQPERMWQEYPSTPDEAFKVSTAGTYYAVQLALARKQGRITTVPYVQGFPVNTFWDIGNGDGTAIWLHQRIGMRHHFIGFIEGWGEPYAYYVTQLQKLGYVWGRHKLPHDGAHVRQGENANVSPEQSLYNLGLRNIDIVPRIPELSHGINAMRDAFGLAWFDETACKDGLAHVEQYKKKWNARQQCWSDEPDKDSGHSEAADSLRQWAQDLTNGTGHAPPKRKTRDWRTA